MCSSSPFLSSFSSSSTRRMLVQPHVMLWISSRPFSGGSLYALCNIVTVFKHRLYIHIYFLVPRSAVLSGLRRQRAGKSPFYSTYRPRLLFCKIQRTRQMNEGIAKTLEGGQPSSDCAMIPETAALRFLREADHEYKHPVNCLCASMLAHTLMRELSTVCAYQCTHILSCTSTFT